VSFELLWTPQARSDLIEIYTHIGLDNPAAAERIFAAIQDKVELLSRFSPSWRATSGDSALDKDVG
jgi:plasmid stabilization system protein ParE